MAHGRVPRGQSRPPDLRLVELCLGGERRLLQHPLPRPYQPDFGEFGQTRSETTDTFEAGQTRQVIVPADARNVTLLIEGDTGLQGDDKWKTVREVDLTADDADAMHRKCYKTTGSTSDMGANEESCPREWPEGSTGSLAYAFDAGNYTIIQLQNYPGYAVDLETVNNALLNFTHPFGKLGHSPGLHVTTGYQFLRDQLTRAHFRGRPVILNMHDDDLGAPDYVPRDRHRVCDRPSHLPPATSTRTPAWPAPSTMASGTSPCSTAGRPNASRSWPSTSTTST